MNIAPQSTPSQDDIKTSFPFPALDKLIGEPTYETINKLETQVIRNAATVEITLPPPHHNLSGIVEQPAVYILRTGGPFPRPTYPSNSPVFPPGSTVAQRQQIQQLYNAQLRNFNIVQRTEKLLLTLIEQAIENTYLAGIYNKTQGFGNHNIQDIFNFLYQTYGRISTNALRANTAKLTQRIAPHLPVAIIFKQIEDCNKFATAGGAPFTPAQILKAVETLILQTGRYNISYREWLALPQPNRTYNNFKQMFTR